MDITIKANDEYPSVNLFWFIYLNFSFEKKLSERLININILISISSELLLIFTKFELFRNSLKINKTKIEILTLERRKLTFVVN